MGQTVTAKQPDRVSFSFGMKLSLPTKYESADFHVSLTSDVNSDETPQQAMNRIKKEVTQYAEKTYTAIRESETGLDKLTDTRDVSVPTLATKLVKEIKEEIKQVPKENKPKDLKVLKQKIKAAFSVLEAQKKITKTDFVTEILGGGKVDNLDQGQTEKVIEIINSKFPDLNL